MYSFSWSLLTMDFEFCATSTTIFELTRIILTLFFSISNFFYREFSKHLVSYYQTILKIFLLTLSENATPGNLRKYFESESIWELELDWTNFRIRLCYKSLSTTNSLMASIETVDLCQDQIDDFQHVHDCVFPVKFPRKFFRDIFKTDNGVSKLNRVAVLDKKTVGVLSARILPTDNDGLGLYITSLGCKIVHRRQGIGSALLREATQYAKYHDCGHIFLHMQEGNEALQFYLSFGFKIERRVPNYYHRLEPSTALVLYKPLT